MRLIDADALIEQMEADAEQMEMTVFKMAAYAAINDVKNQPTIEERKTGEWITHYYKLGTERYECNVCHNRIGDTPYYCPNCGADMRGEQDEP